MSLPLLLALALAGWWWWKTRRNKLPTAEARRLLELPDGADAEAIAAAHRRLILRVHPDAGGSAELTRQVNQARDVLMAEQRWR